MSTKAKKKALGSVPAGLKDPMPWLGRDPVVGDAKSIPDDRKNHPTLTSSDGEVPLYDRITLLIRPDLAEWLRRRKYWERIDMTDDIEEAILAFQAKVGKAYEPVPAKKKRGVV